MTGGFDARTLALLRLVAQRLVGPEGSAADVVRRLGAVQAQELPSALTAVAIRTRARSRAAVEAALDEGSVVRSWPMRGTLHLVPAPDLGWLLDVTRPRLLATTAQRRAQLGLDEPTIARARDLAAATLDGGRGATRAELLAEWTSAGLEPTGGRGYHLLFHLAVLGDLCQGPLRGPEQEFRLLDEWVPDPTRLERDAALGEIARRYFLGHGPATAKDLARWTGLPLRDARTGIAVARADLASAVVDGVEHLFDPRTPGLLEDLGAEAEAVLLVPAFDELLLGYADRSCTIGRDHEAHVVPGGNGVFRPLVIFEGRVVATWRHVGRRGARDLELRPFDGPLPETLSRAAAQAYAALPGDGVVRT